MTIFRELNAQTILLISAIILTSYILQIAPNLLGGTIIVWSLYTLFKYLKMIDAFFNRVLTQDQTSVSRLLKGFKREKHEKQISLLHTGMQNSLLVLIGISLTSSVGLLVFSEGFNALYSVGLVILAGLIFWNFQNISLKIKRAKLITGALIGILSFQLVLYQDLSLYFQQITEISHQKLSLALMAGYLMYIYVRGVITRHRYHYFPILGFVALCFICVFINQLSLMLLPIMSALLSVCFAQSFSTFRPENYLLSTHKLHFS